jgi:zinc protease
VPPPAQRKRLANGVSVWLLPQRSVYCTINVVASGGVVDVPASRADGADVLDLTLNAMQRGSKNYKYDALQDRCAQLEMTHPSWSRYMDAVTFSSTFYCKNFADAVEVMAGIVLRPAFEKQAFERAREQEARGLDDQPSDAATIANLVAELVVFGRHPYGLYATAAPTRAVKREDVVSLHARLFDPSRISVIVGGDLAENETVDALERSFGAARAQTTSAPPVAKAPTTPAGPSLIVVDKPGASGAAIEVGYMGPAAGATDALAARIAAYIATSGSVGRTLRLRDDLKLVPWIETSERLSRVGGILGWRSRTSTDKVAPVLAEIDKIMQGLVSEGPTAGELEVLRRWMEPYGVTGLQTPARSTTTYAQLIGNGLPEETLAQRPARLAAITPDEVRAAAARYLQRASMRAVVVGDLAALREPLLALGWGPVEVRDASGAVVASGRTPGVR